jgi:hypothetical protein
MPFTGNIGALSHLAELLDELSQVPSRATKRIAAEIPPLLQEEFSEGRDPYESPWKPLAPSTLAKGRSAPPLTDIGKMRASARAMAVSQTGVGVMIDAPAGYHQATRPMVPRTEELPDTWREVLTHAVVDEIEAVRRKL